MIRVFLLALLGLGALFMIAQRFPAAPEAPVSLESSLSPGAPFALWNGDWEGTVVTYLPDGMPESTVKVRQEYDSANPAEQSIIITEWLADGHGRVSHGKNLATAGGLSCLMVREDGSTSTYAGRIEGSAILWHRADPAAGVEETIRQEIIRTLNGNLLALDGVRTTGGAGSSRRAALFTGRLHQAERTEE